MNCKNWILSAVVAASLGGCYAYAGPPRHAHYRHRERVVVVEHPRPAPVVVHERVVVRDRRY